MYQVKEVYCIAEDNEGHAYLIPKEDYTKFIIKFNKACYALNTYYHNHQYEDEKYIFLKKNRANHKSFSDEACDLVSAFKEFSCYVEKYKIENKIFELSTSEDDWIVVDLDSIDVAVTKGGVIVPDITQRVTSSTGLINKD